MRLLFGESRWGKNRGCTFAASTPGGGASPARTAGNSSHPRRPTHGCHHSNSVQLGRRPLETPHAELQCMYEELFNGIRQSHIGRGTPEVLRPGRFTTTDDESQPVLWLKWSRSPDEADLVAINPWGQRGTLSAPNQAVAPIATQDNAERSSQRPSRLSIQRLARSNRRTKRRHHPDAPSIRMRGPAVRKELARAPMQ